MPPPLKPLHEYLPSSENQQPHPYAKGVINKRDIEEILADAQKELYFNRNHGKVTVDARTLQAICNKLLRIDE